MKTFSRKRIPVGKSLMITAALLGFCGVASADVKLPAVIGEHMVLQQGMPAPIWGKADPGEAVTVVFAGQTKKAVTGADGRWMVKLDAMKATQDQTGQTLTVTGKNTITLQDVLIGETWICSGQSNMQFGLASAMNAKEEIEAANFPMIRFLTVSTRTAATPQDDCIGKWAVCTPDTAKGFSAVGYFFGRHLYQTLKLPVGLINTSWGGTIAEAWVSADALRKNHPEFNLDLDKVADPSVLNKEIEEYKKKLAEYDPALEKVYTLEKMYALEEDLSGVAKFAAPDIDDSTWKSMNLPGNWELRGLPDLDGIVWFRKTIEVPAAWAGKDIILRPGPIDEVDVTWFNGVQVGAKGNSRTRDVQYWNQDRKYCVPGKLVKAGKNVIAIRVSDTSGQGGLWGALPETMAVELADASDKTRLPLAGDWKYSVEFALPRRPSNPDTPNRPSVLFNAMINPLIPFALRGAIWYQGESNASRPVQYRTLLPTLITDWRTRFGAGDFTFLIVQLANFMMRAETPKESSWAELREAQTLTTTKLPKVGQALAIDIGDAKDIHPRNKQDVGRRLGLAAEAIAYDRKVVYSGPVFKSMQVTDGKAELSFTSIDGGLKVKGDALKGFAVCGADKKYVWANAQIKGDKVIVSAAEVPQPVAVRYAWGDNPECNLVNGADLPAVPFRTDRP
ncbi:MAG: sialate O-acetylesterase [Victivallales bacterium]|jgi:sialate O-acetylesterase